MSSSDLFNSEKDSQVTILKPLSSLSISFSAVSFRPSAGAFAGHDETVVIIGADAHSSSPDEGRDFSSFLEDLAEFCSRTIICATKGIFTRRYQLFY